MELFELLDDELDDFFNNIRRPHRPRIVRHRPNYFNALDDEDFRLRFRLKKFAVNKVFTLIENDIGTTTCLKNAITPINRLLLTLRYFATGSFLVVLGNFNGVSKASASRINHTLKCRKLSARLRPIFAKYPPNVDHIVQGFYNIAKFPRVGVIDCTHISIKSPGGENAEYYRNRKGFFSMNVQTVVDFELRILDIVARWPDSSHDQTIFNNSRIKQRLLDGEFGDIYILGDKGYDNTNYLLTSLHNPSTPSKNVYNESQVRTRNTVERSYGVWKKRFPLLSHYTCLGCKQLL